MTNLFKNDTRPQQLTNEYKPNTNYLGHEIKSNRTAGKQRSISLPGGYDSSSSQYSNGSVNKQ